MSTSNPASAANSAANTQSCFQSLWNQQSNMATFYKDKLWTRMGDLAIGEKDGYIKTAGKLALSVIPAIFYAIAKGVSFVKAQTWDRLTACCTKAKEGDETAEKTEKTAQDNLKTK